MPDIVQTGPYRNGAAVIAPIFGTGNTHVRNVEHGEYEGFAVDKSPGRFLNGAWFDDGVFQSQTAADKSTSLTQDAVVWYTAQAGYTHSVQGITWAYDDNPSNNAKLSVESPSGTAIWGPFNITNGGPGFKNFELLAGSRSQDFLVRLCYAGVSGSIAVDGHRLV